TTATPPAPGRSCVDVGGSWGRAAVAYSTNEIYLACTDLRLSFCKAAMIMVASCVLASSIPTRQDTRALTNVELPPSDPKTFSHSVKYASMHDYHIAECANQC